MSDRFLSLEGSSLKDRVDPFFEKWNSPLSPGVLIAVLSGGSVVYESAFGMADLSNGIPLDSRSVVRIASQSKQFTTSLLLMLERDGLLSLEDDVHDYLPWLPDFEDKVTLHHLAANTSGLRDILEMMTIGGVSILAPSSRAFARNLIARHNRLNFEPGSDLLYSNTNFLLLSEILEKVSNTSFNELLYERITGPLSMRDTRLMVRDDEILPGLAVHHRRSPSGGWLKSAWGIAIGGEGGMVSSLHDMIIWQQNLRSPRVGDASLFARMENTGVLINEHESPYGYGLVRDNSGPYEAIGHGGWIAGARSESVRYKEPDLGIIILSNRDDFAPYVVARSLAQRLLENAVEPTDRPFDLKPGTYREEGRDDAFKIELSNGIPHLVLNMGASPLIPMQSSGWSPQSSIPPFTLYRTEGDALLAKRFGRERRFLPIVKQALSEFCTDTYYSRSGDLEAQTYLVDGFPELAITSREGMQRVRLEAYGEDFFFAHPTSEETHDQWRACPWVLPWLFTVRFSEDSLIINSDRTKQLVFKRTQHANI